MYYTEAPEQLESKVTDPHDRKLLYIKLRGSTLPTKALFSGVASCAGYGAIKQITETHPLLSLTSLSFLDTSAPIIKQYQKLKPHTRSPLYIQGWYIHEPTYT